MQPRLARNLLHCTDLNKSSFYFSSGYKTISWPDCYQVWRPDCDIESGMTYLLICLICVKYFIRQIWTRIWTVVFILQIFHATLKYQEMFWRPLSDFLSQRFENEFHTRLCNELFINHLSLPFVAQEKLTTGQVRRHICKPTVMLFPALS